MDFLKKNFFQAEKRNVFSERGNALQPLNSDEEEEEDGYDSPRARRRGASVDEFLRGSELGRQVPSTRNTLQPKHPQGPSSPLHPRVEPTRLTAQDIVLASAALTAD